MKDSSNTETNTSTIKLDYATEHHEHTLKLIQEAKRSIYIHCHDLTPRIFNHPDIASALSQFITSNSANRIIKIAVKDVQSIINCDHKVLNTFRKLTSNISIHKISEQHFNHVEALIIFDEKIVLRRKDYTLFDGSIEYSAKPAKEQLNLFDEIWSHSEPDQNLNRLYI